MSCINNMTKIHGSHNSEVGSSSRTWIIQEPERGPSPSGCSYFCECLKGILCRRPKGCRRRTWRRLVSFFFFAHIVNSQHHVHFRKIDWPFFGLLWSSSVSLIRLLMCAAVCVADTDVFRSLIKLVTHCEWLYAHEWRHMMSEISFTIFFTFFKTLLFTYRLSPPHISILAPTRRESFKTR